MRWIGAVVSVVLAVGCRGAIPGDAPAPDAGAGKLDGAADARSADTGTTTGPAPADAGNASAPVCPPLSAPNGGSDQPAVDWSMPTMTPFSCAPLPSAFFFPTPGRDVSGAYARCASFADARASALAVDRDGSRVALIGIDGVARIVDVASRTVVGVLAPPRASVGLAAFSPAGDTILTVARGERAVTLWRADTFTPIWTTTLPGHTYQDEYTGAAAFAPDGTTALVSPGGGLYLLDTATGGIRAADEKLGGVVLGAGYGWNGRRIAALVSPLNGMCIYVPHGGSVMIFDPDTLTAIATPMTWPLTGDESPGPGQMLVAADADLIVTSGLESYPAAPPNAFRLSDGGALPTPAIATFPLALAPDGTTAVVGGADGLDLVRLSDGASLATTPTAAPTAVALSADGSTVAAGSSGDNLLGIWRPAAGPLTPTCTADLRASDERSVSASLSADGRTLAVDWGPEIRVLRRADGSMVSAIEHDHQLAFKLMLSPDGRYVIGEFYAPDVATVLNFPMALFRTSDGAQVADLGDAFSYQGGYWGTFVFLPDGRHLDADLVRKYNDIGLWEIDLQSGSVAPKSLSDGAAPLVGTSGDCLLFRGPDPTTLVRSCGSCQPLVVARSTKGGLVSMDGGWYLTSNGDAQVTGTALWSIGAVSGAVARTYPPRPEEAMWPVSETPVAISTHGGRVITGAFENASCSAAPGFTSRVHDVATDTVIDDLPPGITSTSADLGVVAYGAVLWCAR